MKPTSTAEFVLVTETCENQTRMRSNCRVQASILRVMYDNDDSFCDVKLFGVPPTGMQPDSLRPIRAHKGVLACASKHLRDLLTSEDYTDSNLSEYHIENIEHENLRRIVEFIYTDQLTMTTENTVDEMCRVLTGAKYLVMKNLVDACETFLAGDAQIKLENCIKLWFFARKYSCLTLLHETSTFIANNLAIAKEHAEFLRMPFDDCAKLLLCEAMIAADADERCLAVIAWLTHDPISRASFVSDILNMVPLSPDTISVKTISAVHECEMLREYAPDTVRKLMGGLLQQLTSTISSPTGVFTVNHRSLTFGGSGYTDFSHWYMIGGESTRRSFAQYIVQQRSWSRLPALPWGREDCGVCSMGNRLLVMGGSRNGRVTDKIDEYDFSTQVWTVSSAKLSSARKNLAVCSDGQHYTYAVGGDDDASRARHVVEKYNYKSKEVRKLAEVPRSGCAVALTNNRIFAAGGCGRTKFIEAYDICADRWSFAGGRLYANRFKLAGVISGDDFYVAGGMSDCGKAVSTVEIYNIRTGHLRSGRRLLQARYGCGMTTLNNGNVVCVVGGFAGRGLSTVECFDKREGNWSMSAIVPNMPTRASGFGFVAV